MSDIDLYTIIPDMTDEVEANDNERNTEREKEANDIGRAYTRNSIIFSLLGAVICAIVYFAFIREPLVEYIPAVAVVTPRPTPQPTPTPTPFIPDIELPLTRGMRSDDVARLQSYINNIGYTHDGLRVLAVDGSFGPLTQRGVLEFQRIAGLIPHGIVDLDTWYMIYTLNSDPFKYDIPLPPVIPPLPAYFVTIDDLNFRSGPSTGYSIHWVIHNDTSLWVVGYYNPYWYIVEHGGISGYVASAFLRFLQY